MLVIPAFQACKHTALIGLSINHHLKWWLVTKNNNQLSKEAAKIGNNPTIQREINELINQFVSGNNNPGIGTKHLMGDIYCLRGRNGARVFYRMKDDLMEILGKANKSNEQLVIEQVKKTFM